MIDDTIVMEFRRKGKHKVMVCMGETSSVI